VNDTTPPAVPPPSPEDQALLEDLRDARQPDDTVPDSTLDIARQALAWRNVDQELAELVDAPAPVGVRGGHQGRVSFTTVDGVRVDINLAPMGDRVTATGQVSPAGTAATASWESPHGHSDPVEVDELGLFELGGVRAGMVRFVLNRAAGGDIRTSWLVV
jgi:hypothetical protein